MHGCCYSFRSVERSSFDHRLVGFYLLLAVGTMAAIDGSQSERRRAAPDNFLGMVHDVGMTKDGTRQLETTMMPWLTDCCLVAVFVLCFVVVLLLLLCFPPLSSTRTY